MKLVQSLNFLFLIYFQGKTSGEANMNTVGAIFLDGDLVHLHVDSFTFLDIPNGHSNKIF